METCVHLVNQKSQGVKGSLWKKVHINTQVWKHMYNKNKFTLYVDTKKASNDKKTANKDKGAICSVAI